LIYGKIKFSETVSLLRRRQGSHCACANWTYIFSRHPNNREVLHRTVRPLLSFGVVRLATGILYELDRYQEKMRLIHSSLGPPESGSQAASRLAQLILHSPH